VTARRRRALALAALGLVGALAVVALAHRPLLRWVGGALIVDERPEAADAIVVLAGGTPYREMSAARLFQRGVAPRIVISRAHVPDHVRVLMEMGIRSHDYLEESRLVLERRGVPPERIEAVMDVSRITETELSAVGRYAAARAYRRVVLVTSPEHTRRVRLVWSRRAPADVRGAVVAAEDDPFPVDDWWRQRRMAETVLHEYLGLAALTLGISPWMR
jgi:uncharacterized SAM-binding protein YcdF (DUF218 family)